MHSYSRPVSIDTDVASDTSEQVDDPSHLEQVSAKAEAEGSNPVEAPKTFFGLNLRLLKSQSQLR